MALTITDTDASPPQAIQGGTSGYKAVVKTVALDSSYPTGGESLTAAMLGLSTVVFLIAQPTSGYVFEYNYTDSKLLAYYGNYDAADGVLIDVPDTTDLSAVTGIRLFAIGT